MFCKITLNFNKVCHSDRKSGFTLSVKSVQSIAVLLFFFKDLFQCRQWVWHWLHCVLNNLFYDYFKMQCTSRSDCTSTTLQIYCYLQQTWTNINIFCFCVYFFYLVFLLTSFSIFISLC